MDIFDGPYYNVSKWFLEFMGLWPFQSRRRRWASLTLFFICLTTITLPQVLLLAKLRFSDMTVFFENVISIAFATGSLIKYVVTFMSGPQLKVLLLQIRNDWQTRTHESEIKVMSKYANEGRILTLMYAYYLFIAWFLYNMMPFLPLIMDILIPLKNGTHDLIVPCYVDYVFFDQLDYHYEVCIHFAVVYIFTTSLFAAQDTIYAATVKHSCGLFAMTCYKLETMGKSIKRNSSNIEIMPAAVIHRDLVQIIILHIGTIKCVDLLEDSFSLCFLLTQGLLVAALALIVYYGLQVYTDILKAVRLSGLIIGFVMHMLYLNWIGQLVINSSNKLLVAAYMSDWYLIPLKDRCLIHLLMVRSFYPCQLTAGKISVLCMETFAVLLKTTTSYLMVLLSVE